MHECSMIMRWTLTDVKAAASIQEGGSPAACSSLLSIRQHTHGNCPCHEKNQLSQDATSTTSYLHPPTGALQAGEVSTEPLLDSSQFASRNESCAEWERDEMAST